MEDSLVIHHCPVRPPPFVKRTGKNDKQTNAPTTVPGCNCTQYSESGLVRHLFHFLIASYLSMSNQRDRNPAVQLLWIVSRSIEITNHSSTISGRNSLITLLSSLFHLTWNSSPVTLSCPRTGNLDAGCGA